MSETNKNEDNLYEAQKHIMEDMAERDLVEWLKGVWDVFLMHKQLKEQGYDPPPFYPEEFDNLRYVDYRELEKDWENGDYDTIIDKYIFHWYQWCEITYGVVPPRDMSFYK